MDKRIYWIWLQNAFGAGSPKPMQIRERMGSAEAFHAGGISLWSSFSFISDKEIASLNAFGVQEAQAALEFCERLGQTVLTPDSALYPPLLLEIYNPPAVLYLRGEMPDFTEHIAIGVVGTRKASEVGLRAAREISYQLALEDAVVISGGAVGVDAEAHRGAINGRGKTVALLPCGLGYPYLMDNAILRQEILDRDGALLTEYPMNTPVQRGSFHTRNRLISGMTHGVLVAEAPVPSGALITANAAAEQNRDVFVFVGDDEKAFEGCIRLVRDGAVQVRTANDILKSYSARRGRERIELLEKAVREIQKPGVRVQPRRVVLADSVPAGESVPAGVSENAAAVLRVLTAENPLHISEIETQTGLDTGAAMAALTELELFDLIQAFPGQRFTKSGESGILID